MERSDATASPLPMRDSGTTAYLSATFPLSPNQLTMNKPSLFKRIMLPSLAFMLVASLGVGCAGCNGGEADTTGDAANTEGMNADGTSADGSGANGASANASGSDASNGSDAGANGAEGEAGTGATTDKWTRVYATPVEERAGTVENLNGLRATLVAELEQVRGRLKDGTRTAADKKADSTRASELAQGLERLDRTIKEVTEANDVSWAQVRESQIKAAGEFREWMAKYGMPS
jgi:hypothetical protein